MSGVLHLTAVWGNLKHIIDFAQKLCKISILIQLQAAFAKMPGSTELPAVIYFLPQFSSVGSGNAGLFVNHNPSDGLLMARALYACFLPVQKETTLFKFLTDEAYHFLGVKIT